MTKSARQASVRRGGRSVGSVACTFALAIGAVSAGVSGMPQTGWAGDDSVRDARITAFVDAFTASAGVPLDPGGSVITQFVDLNGDGAAEALVTLDSPAWCGARGCSSFVLDLRGTSAVSLGAYTAIEFRPLDSRTGQWRDIAVNGHRQVFQGGHYGPP